MTSCKTMSRLPGWVQTALASWAKYDPVLRGLLLSNKLLECGHITQGKQTHSLRYHIHLFLTLVSTSLAHFPSGQRQHRPSDVGHIVVFLVPAVYGLISESPSGFQSFVMSRAFLSGFWELPEWQEAKSGSMSWESAHCSPCFWAAAPIKMGKFGEGCPVNVPRFPTFSLPYKKPHLVSLSQAVGASVDLMPVPLFWHSYCPCLSL